MTVFIVLLKQVVKLHEDANSRLVRQVRRDKLCTHILANLDVKMESCDLDVCSYVS